MTGHATIRWGSNDMEVDREDRRKVLLIDDSEIVLAVESALLTEAGF